MASRPPETPKRSLASEAEGLAALIAWCSLIEGTYEISHGTAAFDPSLIACGVTVDTRSVSQRFTAIGATTDEAATLVLADLRSAMTSEARGRRSFSRGRERRR